MIKINLLPPETGKRANAAAKAKTGPSAAPFFALLFLLYGAALYGAFWAYQKGEKARKDLVSATATRDKKKAEVQKREKEFEANNLLSQEIEAKYAVVQALGPENRIFWSEKINMIARARMNLAVYLTKLEMTEVVQELETPESIERRRQWQQAAKPSSGDKGKEPPPIKRPVINQTLTIQALAYGVDSPQRLSQIRLFYENLHAFEWTRKSGAKVRFLDRLTPGFGTLPQRLDRVAGVDVMRFGFVIAATPQRDQAEEKKTTGTATAAAPAAPAGGAK